MWTYKGNRGKGSPTMTHSEKRRGDETVGYSKATVFVVCVFGLSATQTWMPIVGVFADSYRERLASTTLMAPLLVSYFATFAIVSIAFALCGIRETSFKGRYGVLVGVCSSLLGITMLFMAQDAEVSRFLLLAISGGLLAIGNCLLLLSWVRILDTFTLPSVLSAVLCAAFLSSMLFAVAFHWGAVPLCLIVTAVMVFAFGCCYVAITTHLDFVRVQPPLIRGLCKEHASVIISFLFFGFIFIVMIMQFATAEHGTASSCTWVFSLFGVCFAGFCLVLTRLIRKNWDSLFAYRFLAILVLIAFFPFAPGSDLSLKFAFSFSVMALSCFMALSLIVLYESAQIMHTPVFFTAGLSIGSFCIGALMGYFVASVIELLVKTFDPEPNYFVFVTAIISIILALLSTNIILTRGNLLAGFKNAHVASIESFEDEGGLSVTERCRLVAECYHLTERELDVLRVLARGYSLARVQEELYISEGTAITHKRHLYRKLGVHSKSELIDAVMRCVYDEEGAED